MDVFASPIASVVTESETSTRKTVHIFRPIGLRDPPSASARAPTNATRSPSENQLLLHAGRRATGKDEEEKRATRKIPTSFGERSTYVAPPRAHDSVESGALQTNRRYTTQEHEREDGAESDQKPATPARIHTVILRCRSPIPRS